MTAACPGCIAVPAEVAHVPSTPNAVHLSVPQIRCAACIATIERHLTGLAGISDARVNLSQKRVQVVTDRPAEELTRELSGIGFEAFPLEPGALAGDTDAEGRALLLRLGIAGFAMMNVMLLSVAVWSGATGATRDLFHLISASIALPTVLYAAQPFFRKAWSALRVRRLNMDVPISLAIVLAGAMSLYESLHGGAHAYFDAALSLTFFLLIGRYLEHRTRAAARSAAKELSALEVHTAQRKTGSHVETVPLARLCVGDRIVVPTGMRVPVDGALLTPEAHTDRSFLTGESEPVSHGRDAKLNAGEINLGAPFEMQAETVGQETRLHQIAGMVETAEQARNRYTSLADRAAQIYAPAVHLLALTTFIGWLILSGDVRHALNVAIAVLIITCPCALGLAVPAVSTAAISRLYQLGFLVKSGTALERLAEAKTVIFDKTGTLTTPGFTFDLTALDPQSKAIAKALAQSSAHPLSKALSHHLGDVEPAPLAALREAQGKGISAIAGQQSVALGRLSWLGRSEEGLGLRIGKSIFALPYQETPIEGARAMTHDFVAQGLDVEIMSGDSTAKTARLAELTGIDAFTAEMYPEDKTKRVAKLMEQGRAPCMVGDGLNDTAALAQAHASVAPGTALDAARSAADVVVLGRTVKDLPALMVVARKAVRLSRQNFGIALCYNAVAIPIAILGYATPLAAALAMSLSSITVLLNAIRVSRTS